MTPTDVQQPLVLEHLTKRYGDHTVVDDLSFTVEPGRVTGFLGPNGSGKSTTMRMMLDLASPDRGTATINGSSLQGPARPGPDGRRHDRIRRVPPGPKRPQPPANPRRRHRHPPRRVDAALEEVGLTDAADRQAGAYSLGMRQRLGLAAALLGEPPILILDEPGNGLDPEGIRTLRDRLRCPRL